MYPINNIKAFLLLLFICTVQFQVAECNQYWLVNVHASFMVFAWMFLASTGIILSKFYRRLMPSKHICGYPVWFPFHVLIAIGVVCFSIAGFVLILYERNWKWNSDLLPINFAHSIMGIIGIGGACLQFLYSICRPSLGSSVRDVFNKIHSLIGHFAFLFANIAILIALFIKRVHLGWVPTGIMMGWLVWLFLVFSTLEILKYFDNRYVLMIDIQSSYPNEISNRFDSVRKFILAAHILVSFSLTVAMIVVFGFMEPTRILY